LPDLLVNFADPLDVDESGFSWTSRERNEENRVDEEAKGGRFVSVRDSRVLEDVDEAVQDGSLEGRVRAESDVAVEEAREDAVIGRSRVGVGIDDVEQEIDMFCLFEERDEDFNHDGVLLELLNVRKSLHRESLSSNVRDPSLNEPSENLVVLDDPFLVVKDELFDDESCMVSEVSSSFEARFEELRQVRGDMISNRLSVFAKDDCSEGWNESFVVEASEEEVGGFTRVKSDEFRERSGEDARLKLLEKSLDVDDHLDDIFEVLTCGGSRKKVEDVDDRCHNFEFSIFRRLLRRSS